MYSEMTGFICWHVCAYVYFHACQHSEIQTLSVGGRLDAIFHAADVNWMNRPSQKGQCRKHVWKNDKIRTSTAK